jgi:hypothetical protein
MARRRKIADTFAEVETLEPPTPGLHGFLFAPNTLICP